MADEFKKHIRRIFAPIIACSGWEDMVTEEMKSRIEIERFASSTSDTATDYEAMVYLHTASLTVPIIGEWYNIYTFLFSKYHPEQAKEIGVYRERITELEERELKNLKE